MLRSEAKVREEIKRGIRSHFDAKGDNEVEYDYLYKVIDKGTYLGECIRAACATARDLGRDEGPHGPLRPQDYKLIIPREALSELAWLADHGLQTLIIEQRDEKDEKEWMETSRLDELNQYTTAFENHARHAYPKGAHLEPGGGSFDRHRLIQQVRQNRGEDTSEPEEERRKVR